MLGFVSAVPRVLSLYSTPKHPPINSLDACTFRYVGVCVSIVFCANHGYFDEFLY